jgi:hypothetical protein
MRTDQIQTLNRARRITNGAIEDIQRKIGGLRQLEQVMDVLIRALTHERDVADSAQKPDMFLNKEDL